ncbi:MAG: Ig-like domain repeat protein, partial [Methanobrevibacter thaueri]|nr:Ig-like domain repeat protein [Methanobrevibacter thaueri]
MIMNFNSKILIISLILIFAISVSAVSANENISDVQNAVEQNASTVSIDDVNTVDSINSNQVDENNLGSAEGQDKVSAGEYGTFTELQNLIDNNDVVNLDKDYMWDLSFNNGDRSGVKIGKAITINGNGHTIDGAGESRIFSTYNTGDVIINNVTFKHGGYVSTASAVEGVFIQHQSKGILKISNSTFKDFKRYGSEYVCAAAIRALGRLSLDNCYFTNMFGNDGLVYMMNNGNSNITNCYFENCRSEIRGNNGAKILITNTTFNSYTDGYAATWEKKVNIKFVDCKFNGEYIAGYGDSTTGSNCTMENCILNHARLIISTNCRLDAVNTTFTNSSPSSAITFKQYSFGNITDSYFINNSAEYGAGINLNDYANVNITNCHFINNTAGDCGGAIAAAETSNVNITNPEYINNKAKILGDDFYQAQSNRDKIYVGVEANGTGTNTSSLASLKFAINNIMEGGIIYLTSGNYTGFNVNKKMTLYGLGEVYITGHTLVYASGVKFFGLKFVNLSNGASGITNRPLVWYGDYGLLQMCDFINNTANWGFSAVIWNGNYGTISECNFIGNTAKMSFEETYKECAALRVIGSNLTITESNFYDNAASKGPAIYATEALTITDCEFKNNIAKDSKFTQKGSENNVTINFANSDTFLNAIFTNVTEGNRFTNVRYWDGTGLKNTNQGYPTNKGNYTINIKVYEKVTGILLNETNLITDINGSVSINNLDPNYYLIVVSHYVGETVSTSGNFEFAYGKKIAPMDIIFSNNINPGDDLIVVANLPADATGNVTFTLNNVTYVRNVSDGQAVLTLKAYNLVGKYPITALYSGDSVYYPQDADVILAITPVLTSNVVISNDDVIAIGDTVTLTGKVNFNIVNGVLQFVIKSGNDVVIINGTRGAAPGVWNADYKFTQTGNYIISAQYYGINMDVTEGSVTARNISQINVSADTIDYKQDAIIKFTVPVNATGVIALTIGTETKTVSLNPGHNGTILYPVSGLNAGEYTVIAEYLGDLVFAPSFANTTLTVNKINTELLINSINNNNIITISANIDEKATGTIVISIGGNIFNVNSGEEKTVSGLEAGVYDISAVYNGDVNFNPQTNMSNVVITKKPIIITASANPIMEGETAIITITSNVNITGYIFIDIYKINTFANINGTTTDAKINDLPAGVYTATIKFNGDDTYEGNTTTVKVTVNPLTPSSVDPKMNLTYIKDVNLGANV